MPSIAVSKPYEAIYILDPDSSEEQIESTVSKYKQTVATAGGEVTGVDVWERRRLAYPVKGRTEGIYVIMLFSGEPKAEVELRRIFQISEDQIRYMIIKPEPIEPEKDENISQQSTDARTPEIPSSGPVATMAQPEQITEPAQQSPVPDSAEKPVLGETAEAHPLEASIA